MMISNLDTASSRTHGPAQSHSKNMARRSPLALQPVREIHRRKLEPPTAAPGQRSADPNGPASNPSAIDLKLLAYVYRRGGYVSVRQVTRSLATCRTVADAKLKLAAMVRAGLGVWVYSRPGPRGGRPSRLFALMLSQKQVEAQLHRSRKVTTRSPVSGPPVVRQIVRDLVMLVNDYPHTPCSEVLKAMGEARGIFTRMSKSPGEHMLRAGGRRHIRVNAAGQVSTTWKCR